MNLLPFSTQQSIQTDGFYAKETKYSPTIVHFKDNGCIWWIYRCLKQTLKRYLLDLNVKPEE